MSEDTTDTESRCQRGTQCEARQPSPDGRTWTPAETDRPLCHHCEDAAVDALAATPTLYVALRNKTLDRQGSGAQSDYVRRSRARSFGLNPHPLFLSETVHWTVTTWADETIHTAGRPCSDRTSQPEGQQVQDACLLLRAYMPVWLNHAPVEFALTRDNPDPEDPKAEPTKDEVSIVEAGWQACSWLLDWRRATERTLKIPPLVHYPPEPCPACNQPRVLKRHDGSDKVSCTNCGKAWTLAMYETFVHAWIGSQPATDDQPHEHHGPRAAAEGQDARRGTAAHAWPAA